MKQKVQFQKQLKPGQALIVSSYSNILYLTQLPIFSKEETEAYVIITKKDIFIITDRRYTEELSRKLNNFQVIESSAIGFIKKDLSSFLKKQKIKKLFYEETISLFEYNIIRKSINLSPFKQTDFRIIKQPWEIENIKKATRIADETFKYVLGKLKKGVSEKKIAFEIEYYIKKKGFDISFKPIVAFGKNSSVPHHLSDTTKLTNNQIVLLDFGAISNNYCSDITRTIFFGKADSMFLELHKIVRGAQEKAISYLNSTKKPIAKEADKAARKHIKEAGFDSFNHSLGHGIGIEAHESPTLSPKSNQALSLDMVFTIEPGIYIEGIGGVRIEDMALVTKNGIELISKSNRGIIEL